MRDTPLTEMREGDMRKGFSSLRCASACCQYSVCQKTPLPNYALNHPQGACIFEGTLVLVRFFVSKIICAAGNESAVRSKPLVSLYFQQILDIAYIDKK